MFSSPLALRVNPIRIHALFFFVFSSSNIFALANQFVRVSVGANGNIQTLTKAKDDIDADSMQQHEDIALIQTKTKNKEIDEVSALKLTKSNLLPSNSGQLHSKYNILNNNTLINRIEFLYIFFCKFFFI